MIAVSLLLLALGLAMDAFAAAVAQGASVRPGAAGAARIGAAFGAAQAIMPILGWMFGLAFSSIIREIDHWIALGVLSVLGVRMIVQGFRGDDDVPAQRLAGWTLLMAAFATSVDAAAAGVTLPLLGAPLLVACATIGLTTAVLSYAGVWLGAAAGNRIGKAAEIAGGLVLVGLGVKIFIQHQFFGAG
jgi:putative Mn2+ efflux pump MntP